MSDSFRTPPLASEIDPPVKRRHSSRRPSKNKSPPPVILPWRYLLPGQRARRIFSTLSLRPLKDWQNRWDRSPKDLFIYERLPPKLSQNRHPLFVSGNKVS
ncbi:unnamed protein product [Protopolystoma xenopodis]|uniref:Uncharacterized protein n=1 Tax=Protopolystoma xenopodis TaxID=117903 RepID=A0A448X2N9_9PLAT|nr:unnamed protein product [Protopolystoma xenopodis]